MQNPFYTMAKIFGVSEQYPYEGPLFQYLYYLKRVIYDIYAHFLIPVIWVPTSSKINRRRRLALAAPLERT